MRLMGIDFGERRWGVALSDEGGTLARPLTTLEGRDKDRALAQLARLAREHQVGALVVGLPRNMDGSLGPAARNCQELAGILERKTRLPVHLQDERLTTTEALESLRARGVDAREAKARVDEVAAAMILQSFLDR